MSTFRGTTPVLRSFDEAKAREFYIDFLGFEVAGEHRFQPGSPLYLILVRDGTELHVSEHFGDATPGAQVRIEVEGVTAYVRGLRAKAYRHAAPGDPEATPWETLEATITDPAGNRLTFWERG